MRDEQGMIEPTIGNAAFLASQQRLFGRDVPRHWTDWLIMGFGTFALWGFVIHVTSAKNEEAIRALQSNSVQLERYSETVFDRAQAEINGLRQQLTEQRQGFEALALAQREATTQVTQLVQESLSPEALERAAILARVRHLEAERLQR